MIQAINKYVIVEKKEEENISSTDIITSTNPTKITYIVVATTEETKDLQNKQIFIKESTELEDNLLAVHIDNILAWKEADSVS